MRCELLVSALVLTLATAVAHAETDVRCFEYWRMADKDSNGALYKSEDDRSYIATFEAAGGKSIEPGVLSRDEFMRACEADVFSNAAATAPAPPSPSGPAKEAERPRSLPKDLGKGDITPGPATLTEDQARSRLREQGFADVSGLALDDKGVWRGEAVVNGKRVPVAVDPQGDPLGGK